VTPVPSPRSSAARPSGSRTASHSSNGSGSGAETPAPDAVRTALRALATGAPPPRPRYHETLADADAATDSALDAAAFLRAGRLPELARAVADAEAAGRGETSGAVTSEEAAAAERGRRALSTLRRLDAAVERAFGSRAGDEEESGGPADAGRTAAEGRESAVTTGGTGHPDDPRVGHRDHFHCGHDIVLPRTDQSADR
jgi:hypothetical protein